MSVYERARKGMTLLRSGLLTMNNGATGKDEPDSKLSSCNSNTSDSDSVRSNAEQQHTGLRTLNTLNTRNAKPEPTHSVAAEIDRAAAS